MKNWVQAWKLASMEMIASKRNIMTFLIFLVLINYFIIELIKEYLEKPFFMIDILFLLLFTVIPVWLKPSAFQLQSNGSNYYAPSVVLYKQLPISEDVIIKNRFIIYFTYALPLQVLTLLAFYLFSPTMQATLMFSEYLAFSIIWLAFGMYVGAIFVASDTGENGLTKWKLTFYLIIYLIGFVAILYLFHGYFEQGILQLSILAAKEWPIASIIISLVLAFGGYHYWYRMTGKIIRKSDFF